MQIKSIIVAPRFPRLMEAEASPDLRPLELRQEIGT
jgi:hypothetical protein